MMAKLITTSLTILSVLVQPSYAQVVRRRRFSLARVIAGCIIGGIAAFVFLILCIVMTRRRRAGRFMAVTPGNGSTAQYGPKPMFGGPWGRSNAQPNVPMGPYPNQGSNYANYNGPQPAPPVHQSTTPYKPEYPGPNDSAPPPMYGKDANYSRQYSPPSGPPPFQGNISQGPYTPPPGPPPAAHTTGQDNQFVGGFRS